MFSPGGASRRISRRTLRYLTGDRSETCRSILDLLSSSDFQLRVIRRRWRWTALDPRCIDPRLHGAGLLCRVKAEHSAVKLIAASTGIGEVLSTGGNTQHHSHDLVIVRPAQRLVAPHERLVWESLQRVRKGVSSTANHAQM